MIIIGYRKSNLILTKTRKGEENQGKRDVEELPRPQPRFNRRQFEEETKVLTIETKIAKNGAKLYYVDGKRISRDKAIEIQGKSLARTLADKLNSVNEKRVQACLQTGYPLIIPFAIGTGSHYTKLHPVARWTVGYDTLNDTYGIWSEYGWHTSGFSLGYEFCGWYTAEKLILITNKLYDAIERGDKEFVF